MTARRKANDDRPPLTDDELKQLFLQPWRVKKMNLTDDEARRLREIEEDNFRRRGLRYARMEIEEQPLLQDLRSVGFDVDSVWSLYKFQPYPEAVPILLKHLTLPYMDRIKDGIARALAVPGARSEWAFLVAEYKRAEEGYEYGFKRGAKFALALTLSVLATSADIDELIDLAGDPANGESRLGFLHKLKRSKNERAKRALEHLANDPDLTREIASWTKRKRKPRA